MAFLFGAVLGMALFGALFAWILRWIFPLPLYWSYAFGIALMAPAAALSYSSGEAGISYFGALTIYGLGGVLAFPMLVSTSLIGSSSIPQSPRPRGRLAILIVKGIGWLMTALSFAAGLTCVFVAIKTQHEPGVPFFFGIILLLISVGLGWLLKKDWSRADSQ